MKYLEWFTLIMQAFLGCMIILWKMWAREIAEVLYSSSALSQSLDVWMLLCCSLQIGLQQILPTQRILIQGKIKEGLFLIEISSALCILKRKCCKNIFKPIRSNIVQKLREGGRLLCLVFLLGWRLFLSFGCCWLCISYWLCWFPLFNDLDKRFDCFFLVINKYVGDFSIEPFLAEHVISIFAILFFDERLVKADLVHFDGILSPLPSQMLFVHCKQSFASSYFDEALCMLRTIFVNHVEG